MKSILVPVDFSGCAGEAVKMAGVIAAKNGAHIYLLHMFPNRKVVAHVPHVYRQEAHPAQDAAEGYAKSNLHQLIREAEKRGLNATPVFVYDSGNEKIADYIGPYKIDLVVMGSHGTSGIREHAIGSNAQHIVSHVEVPVLVVKSMPDDPVIKNIALASSLRGDLTGTLNWVTEIAGIWNASIALIFVNVNNDLTKINQAKGIVKALGHRFPGISITSNEIETNDEAWGISQFVKNYAVDMIAISRNDHDGHFTPFTRNIAGLLVNHERVPVLVV